MSAPGSLKFHIIKLTLQTVGYNTSNSEMLMSVVNVTYFVCTITITSFSGWRQLTLISNEVDTEEQYVLTYIKVKPNWFESWFSININPKDTIRCYIYLNAIIILSNITHAVLTINSRHLIKSKDFR